MKLSVVRLLALIGTLPLPFTGNVVGQQTAMKARPVAVASTADHKMMEQP